MQNEEIQHLISFRKMFMNHTEDSACDVKIGRTLLPPVVINTVVF